MAARDDGAIEVWPDREQFPAPPWPDWSVRRFVEVPFAAASAVPLDERVVVPHGWLVLSAASSVSAEERRRDGTVHVRRWHRGVGVELVMAHWSATRTEVRLQLGSGLPSLHLPPHYFDVAHAVMDEIRAAIEAQTPVAPRSRRHLRLIHGTG